MPSVSELPNFISSIRHPRRNRSISIGPQSAADAYETLAFRQKWRRESHSAGAGSPLRFNQRFPKDPEQPLRGDYAIKPNGSYFTGDLHTTVASERDQPYTTLNDTRSQLPVGLIDLPQPTAGVRSPSQDRRQNEKDEKEIFSMLEKPRVRYDVEVITKLIVYSGKRPSVILDSFT